MRELKFTYQAYLDSCKLEVVMFPILFIMSKTNKKVFIEAHRSFKTPLLIRYHLHTRPTSQVLDEVLQLHFAVSFDAFVVQVSVEHDASKGKQKNYIWPVEGLDHPRVPVAVLTCERL